MIKPEQVRILDQKITAIIEVVAALRKENKTLKKKLSGYEERIEELQGIVNGFKEEQDEIEAGIIRAIDQLQELEKDLGIQPKADQNISPENRESDNVASGPIDETIAAAEEDTPVVKGQEKGEEEDKPATDEESRELDIF